ncbi:phosphoglycerate kinase [bacterium (Candidatus Howlettbacteria) CG_4_10_14_0_8_um_filter_40_9]|nr:MAG: phosphoglycerate kinase [bacterium (Candidatus Howlettbacteria) CG_4_10_14_0_8_um_filter_40_9]
MKTLKEADVKNKRVLVRVDFNVPLEKGRILDDSKIRAHLKTINYLTRKGARVVLMSHLGRPKGKKVKEFSLKPVAKVLEDLIKKNVTFIPEAWGSKTKAEIEKMKQGEVCLLENLRYYEGESLNDSEFAKKLSELGDIFVQDAFANCHRTHASMVGVPKLLPSYVGLLLEDELKNLDKYLKNPKKPFICVIGGAKISTKIEVLKTLMKKADVLIIGGGMANTFIEASGFDTGNSLAEAEYVDEADEIIRDAGYEGVELLLPADVIVTKKMKEGAKTKVKDISEVSKGDIIVDIGPRTVGRFAEPIKFAGTIFWNGPLGVTEIHKFAKDTTAIAKLIAESGAITIVGGGDTIAAIEKTGYSDKFTYVSTGGGATMRYIQLDGKLPGIEALG